MNPELRLAAMNAQIINIKGFAPPDDPTHVPGILVSYLWLHLFNNHRPKYTFRDYVLDSGAFTAYQTGRVIDLDKYVDDCHTLLETDPDLVEIVALDVIGSDRGSLANTVHMHERGIPAMPVFHIGDDWAILDEYCAMADRVGLSCRFGETQAESYRFYDQCFARQWPQKFHSFGWTAERMLMRYPLHSSDSTSWGAASTQYGFWRQFNRANLGIRTQHDTKGEVEWYLAIERKLQTRWRQEMRLLDSLPLGTKLQTSRASTHSQHQAGVRASSS